MEKTLVIGVGNPLQGDDGVGPAVASALCQGREEMDLLAFAGTGLDLLPYLSDRERVVLIDSLVADHIDEGECVRIERSRTRAGAPPPLSSQHVGLFEAMEMAEEVGLGLPREIHVYGIGIRRAAEFRDHLSPVLAHRVARIAEDIRSDLEQGEAWG